MCRLANGFWVVPSRRPAQGAFVGARSRARAAAEPVIRTEASIRAAGGSRAKTSAADSTGPTRHRLGWAGVGKSPEASSGARARGRAEASAEGARKPRPPKLTGARRVVPEAQPESAQQLALGPPLPADVHASGLTRIFLPHFDLFPAAAARFCGRDAMRRSSEPREMTRRVQRILREIEAQPPKEQGARADELGV